MADYQMFILRRKKESMPSESESLTCESVVSKERDIEQSMKKQVKKKGKEPCVLLKTFVMLLNFLFGKFLDPRNSKVKYL